MYLKCKTTVAKITSRKNTYLAKTKCVTHYTEISDNTQLNHNYFKTYI